VAPPTASFPRASGAFTKLSPLDQTYSTLHSTQKQAPTRPPADLHRSISRIDTGKLEALAGVKIRSSNSPQPDSEEASRAEQWFVQGKQLLRVGDLRRAEACFRPGTATSPA